MMSLIILRSKGKGGEKKGEKKCVKVGARAGENSTNNLIKGTSLTKL